MRQCIVNYIYKILQQHPNQPLIAWVGTVHWSYHGLSELLSKGIYLPISTKPWHISFPLDFSCLPSLPLDLMQSLPRCGFFPGSVCLSFSLTEIPTAFYLAYLFLLVSTLPFCPSRICCPPFSHCIRRYPVAGTVLGGTRWLALY